MLGDPDRDLALRAVELRLRLQHIERGAHRRRGRGIPGAFVILLPQPGAKALAAQRPGFAVAIDDEIGKCHAVARVEEPGGARHIEQNVGAHHGIRPFAGPRALLLFDRRPPRRGACDGGALSGRGSAATRSGSGAACTATGSVCSISRVCPQSLRATSRGSMPAAFHQPALVADPVQGAVVAAAERHHEFVADLAAERARLGEAQVVRVGGRAARRSGRAAGRRTAGAPCCGGAWARRA